MKQKIISSLFFVICLHFLFAQQKTRLDHELIDQFIKKQMTTWKIPGCAIAIVKGTEVLYTKGYGFRNEEKKLPVTPNTIFKIASCTKSFTAAAAALLVDQKILEWDKPVKEYLPQLEFVNRSLTDQVTLRDLLCHRTGIYDDDWSWVGDHIDEKRMYEILSVMPQQAGFRNSYMYSNMCYALVGQLIAAKSLSSWRNNIRKDFFDPLDFQSSTFSHGDSGGLPDFAYGYEYADSSQSLKRGNLAEHCTDSLSVCEAFGFISSSAIDLSKWIRLFINGGRWNGTQIIPAGVFNELIKPINFIDFSSYKELSESYYCMGWAKNYYKTHSLLQHSGGLSGFKCYMSFMPADSIGIVVLTNGQPYKFAQALSYDLYDIVLDLPKTLWTKRFLEEKTRAGNPEAPGMNIKGTKPSLPLSEYAGTYHSKWLGDMKVIFTKGELYFKFHNYPEEKMKHAHYDTFFTEADRKAGNGITFRLNHDGKITGLMLNEFEFQKVID